jgi:hypothetical protein
MARKAARKAKGQKNTPSKRKAGAGARAAARSGAGARKTSRAGRNTGRKTAGARTPQGKARRKKATNPPRPGKRKDKSTRQAGAAKARSTSQGKGLPRRRRGAAKAGGAGREETLAQTPETGRSVRGITNPMATRRSTGTAAGAGGMRRAPGLERERKQLREVEESIPGPPSSLNMDRHGSAARTGRANLRHAKHEHTETSPALTGGDVDADWEDAYAVGDEAPGGDNPTPDQDVVDDIGRALGIEYQDNEELKASDKVAERDKKRWELDPASAEDYKDRD